MKRMLLFVAVLLLALSGELLAAEASTFGVGGPSGSYGAAHGRGDYGRASVVTRNNVTDIESIQRDADGSIAYATTWMFRMNNGAYIVFNFSGTENRNGITSMSMGTAPGVRGAVRAGASASTTPEGSRSGNFIESPNSYDTEAYEPRPRVKPSYYEARQRHGAMSYDAYFRSIRPD